MNKIFSLFVFGLLIYLISVPLFAVTRSRVIIVRDHNVFVPDHLHDAQEKVDRKVLAKMLAVGLKDFYHNNSSSQGLMLGFGPKDRVAIKVNALNAYFAPPFANFMGITNQVLVAEVARQLISSGVKPSNIIVFDRLSLNATGRESVNVLLRGRYDWFLPKGVQLVAGGDFGPVVCLQHGQKMNFLKTLYKCNKVINMPILKAHAIAGFSFTLKNNFGSIKPANMPLTGGAVGYASAVPLHKDAGVPGIADLNSQPIIKDKTKLIVGDILRVQYRSFHYDPEGSWAYDGIIIGSDPVAVDTVAWHILRRERRKKGVNYFILKPMNVWYMASAKQRKSMEYYADHLSSGGKASAYLHDCSMRGLGADDMSRIDLKIINLH
ncbi:MAG: DUF362 domain-containing protein [Gammaproteobacteria bacterium]|nr:DUF362 domain-containing protein [Gammaproteobacteria bacterium]